MYLVETVGVEPTSRNIGTQASTSVVDILLFRVFFRLSTGIRSASLIGLFHGPQAEDFRRSPLRVSPLPYHMGDGGRNRYRLLLSSESEVVVFFASYYWL